MRTLRRLLGPDAEDLLSVFGQDAWRGRIAPAAARNLFDWPRLNAVLATQRFDGARLRLSGSQGAQPVDRVGRVRGAEVAAALRGGATLILNAADEASPPLRDLCAGLAADFTSFCQANLYACWGAKPGFDVHWDDHDVLVVQAEGRKLWALYGPTREAPLLAGDPADHRPPPTPLGRLALEAGDVLYFPRGYWHAAVGVGEPSLHLTVGLTRRTGSDLLHWLADHLLGDPLLRRDLPFEQGDAAVAGRLAEILALAQRAAPAALASAYRRHVEASLPAPAALSLPAIGGEETAPAGADRLTLAAGAARLEAGAGPGIVVLSWRGVRFTLAGVLQPLLERLVAGEAVAAGEFAACAGSGPATAFLRDMVGRGVLRLAPAPDNDGA